MPVGGENRFRSTYYERDDFKMLRITRYDARIMYKGSIKLVTVYEGYNSWIFCIECLYPGAEIIDFQKGGFING